MKLLYCFNENLILWLQFSHSVMSHSLQPHGLQQANLLSPSTTPRTCSNSWHSSRWCHLTISSSVIPFFYCLQTFPESGCFPMSQVVASGGQSIGVSASASVLSMNIQDLIPLGWTGWISLLYKGLSRVFSKDGGGIGRGDHFLPNKFIKRTYKHWINSTKQLLNAGRGHQHPEKQPIVFERR